MITRRGLPIQLVVADSEPLISLAACDRLELLREFRCPVRVPDVVQAECLRHPDKIGAADLQQWFGALDCPAVELPTPFLTAWHQAIAEEASEPDRHTSAGIGDAAVAWLLRQAQLGTVLDSPTLLLTEDGPFGDGVVRDRFPEVQVPLHPRPVAHPRKRRPHPVGTVRHRRDRTRWPAACTLHG